nr:hypothetical protein CFP56_24324 [Quercus suber]
MNYLKYIEHSAENLQFYLWYQDYKARWSKLSSSERALSPAWEQVYSDTEPAGHGSNRPKRVNPAIADILKDTDFADNNTKSQSNPFDTPSKLSSDVMSEYRSSMADDKTLASSIAHEMVADQAFEDAGMKWKPCMLIIHSPLIARTNAYNDKVTTQPFRDEVNRVITTYIAEGSPRELNLSSRERQSVLQALQNTTHPLAFQSVVNTVEYSLRKQAHSNFIRWTICNGNRPRVVFARGLGVSLILIGLIADLLITLSGASRGWRVLPFPAWFIGIATLVAAWKGMCVVLHGLHHRHVRPWELFADEADNVMDEKDVSMSSDTSSNAPILANSYEDAPWVAKYQRRNIVRKVFDRQYLADASTKQGLFGCHVAKETSYCILTNMDGYEALIGSLAHFGRRQQ